MQNTSLSLVSALITTADCFPTQLIIASSALPPTFTVISGRLPAGNLLILHLTRATAGNREVRVM